LENHYSASGLSDDSNICHTDSRSSEIDLSFIEFIGDIKSLYAFDKKIGDGKFGTVFLAHPRSDPKSKVAIKLIPQVSFSHRIEKELALLKSIDHLNVIRYISAYRDKAFFYIVTEY
jgi:serine/threonine protein kinase